MPGLVYQLFLLYQVSLYLTQILPVPEHCKVPRFFNLDSEDLMRPSQLSY